MQCKRFRPSRLFAATSVLVVVVVALSGTTHASCGSYLHTRHSSPAHHEILRVATPISGLVSGVSYRAEIWHVNLFAPMTPADSSWPERPCHGHGCRQQSFPLSTAPLAVHTGSDFREADVFRSGDSGFGLVLSGRRALNGPAHAASGFPQPIDIPPEV